jgi:peptidoglycan/LPS O-acetylase OafA/YrhL
MSPGAERNRRDGWIDMFRGFAAVSVVLFHFSVLPFTGTPGPITSAWRRFWGYGYLGVAVFFALSGYCIARTWLRAPGWLDFSIRRIRRIYPAYWSSLGLLILVAGSRKLATGINDVAVLPRTAPAIIATLALATAPLSEVKTVNWVYWTLTCEVIFYVILALVLAFPRARVRVLVVAHVGLCAAASSGMISPVGPFFFVDYWPMFGAGAALAIAGDHRSSAWVMLGACAAYAIAGHHESPQTAYAITAFITTALIWFTRRANFPHFLSPFRSLGLFSYSLYLVHVPIGVYLLMRLLPAHFPSDFPYLAEELIVLAGTIGAARIFFVVAEKPFAHLPAKT